MSIRKTALEALKTKFEGIDEKVLSRIAYKIAKTANDEEEAKEQVEDYTLQGVIDAYTDSRVTDGVKTYEEKHGLKDGKKVKKETDTDDDDGTDDDDDDKGSSKKTGKKSKASEDDDDMPSWAKALMAKVDSLENGKRVDTRKTKLDKLLENLPEKAKKSYLREFSRASFKDDEDFENWIEEITPDIEDAADDQHADTSTSGKPKGGGGGNTDVVNPLVQARVDARKAETSNPAIKGLTPNNE